MSRQKKIETPAKPEVIVTVSGGVAEVVQKPLGVTVVIVDYDIGGANESDPGIFRDSEGDLSFISRWRFRDELNPNRRGPIVREGLGGGYCRPWKCPECGRTIKVTYEELAVVGSPICSDCDQPMDML
jgi:hypothetical protein